MKALLLAWIALGVAACTFAPSVSSEEAATLQAAARPLLEMPPGISRQVPPAEWPRAFLEILDPMFVTVSTDGVYVTTSEFFVEAKGVFISRDAGFKATQGTDPSFTRITPGVFKFHSKG